MIKNNLKSIENKNEFDTSLMEAKTEVTEERLFSAIVYIGIAMGIGATLNIILNDFLSAHNIKLKFPAYLMGMVVAAIIRNILDFNHKQLPFNEVGIIGNISLSLFLSMALMSMKLWQLIDLALPLIIILLVQTVVMALFAYYVTFNIMGRDYDAAVIATGHCGFGLGATSNAIANMEAFTDINGPSQKAFFVIPIVGSLFIDFINALVIQGFSWGIVTFM
jgi:sodium/glutamate symporter